MRDKGHILLIVLILCSSVASLKAQFYNVYGTSAFESGKNVLIGFDGNYLVTGTHGSSSSNKNIFISKMSPDGTIIWTKSYGGNGDEEIWCMTKTLDSAYVFAGSTSSAGNGNKDGWLVKVDTSGNIIWSTTVGGGGFDEFRNIYQAMDSSYIIPAYTGSYGSGSYDAWVLKFTKTGSLVWTKVFGKGQTDYAVEALQTNGGQLYTMLYFVGHGGALGGYDWVLAKMNPNGSIIQWFAYGGNYNEGCRDFLKTHDNGFLMVGETDMPGNVSKPMVIKIDSNANQISRRIYSMPYNGFSDIYRAFNTKDSGFMLLGHYKTSAQDALIMKLDKNLDLQWSKLIDLNGTQISFDGTFDPNENVYYWTGYTTQNTGFGGTDFFVAKLDLNGSYDCRVHDSNIADFTPPSGSYRNSTLSFITVDSTTGGGQNTFYLSPSAVTFQVKNFNMDPDSVPLNLPVSAQFCVGDSIVLDATSKATKWSWNTGDTTAKVSAKSTKTYTVRAERDYCYNYDSTNVSVRDSLKLIVVEDTFICDGGVFNYQATGQGGESSKYSITWRDSATMTLVSSTFAVTDTPEVSTTYRVELRDSCTAYHVEKYVRVHLKNPLNLSEAYSDTLVCSGEWITLHVDASGGDSSSWNVVWDHGLGTGFSKSVSISDSMEFVAILTDGCSILGDTARFRVNTRAPLSVSFGSDTLICYGENILLNPEVEGGLESQYTFDWNNALGSTGYHNVTLFAADTFRVIVSDNCSEPNDTAERIVLVRNPLQVATSSDTTVCQGETFFVRAFGTGGVAGSYQYDWNNGLSSNDTIQLSLDTSKTLNVILSDNCSLADTGEVTITVRDFLDVTVRTDTTICKGQSVLLSATASGGYSNSYAFDWDNGLGTGQTKMVSPDNTTSYRVILSDNCSRNHDSDEVTITVRPPLQISVRSDTTICRGEEVYLYTTPAGGYSSNYSFSWNNGAGTSQSPKVAPTHTTTYRVILSDNCSTKPDTQYVTINVRDSLSVILNSDTTICKGEYASLRANTFGGLTGAHTLSWSAGLNGDSIHSVNPENTTSYEVILRDYCTVAPDTAHILVTVRPPLVVTPRSDTTICLGESVLLSATGGGGHSPDYQFSWNQGIGSGQTRYTVPDSTTTYRVILTDNCTVRPDTGFVTVTVRPPLDLQPRTDTTICVGESVLLHTTSSGGYAPNHHYDWDQGAGSGNYLSVSPAVSTRYQVILTDNCTVDGDTDYVDILVRAPLDIQARTDSILCIGESVTLWADAAGGDSSRYRYTWNQGLDTGRVQMVSPDTTTTYRVVLSDACTVQNDTSEVTILVRPPLDITERSDTFICVGEIVRLYAEGSGGYAPGYTFTWDSGLDTGNQNTVNPPVTTTYRVILTDNCTSDPDTGFTTVIVREPLTLIKRSDTTICVGEEVELYFEGTGGDSQHYTFIWNHDAGTGNYRKVTPDSTIRYIVHLTDNCTLESGIDSVDITVRAPLELQTRSDTTLCVGEGVYLYSLASGGYSPQYDWIWDEGIGSNAVPLVYPDTTTVFTSILTDYCTVASDTDSVTIFVRPPLEVTPQSDTLICVGEFVNLHATASGGYSPQYAFDWGNGLDTGQLNWVSPHQDSVFQVVLSDACTVKPDTNFVTVRVRDPLSLSPRNDSILCIGESIRLYASGSGGDSSYYFRWNQGADTIDQPIVSPTVTTVYEVIVRDACTVKPDTGFVTINVRQPLDVTARPDTFLCRGESVYFYAAGTGGDSTRYSYTWDNGIGLADGFPATIDSTITYRVILQDQCTELNDTDYVTIHTRQPLALDPRTDSTICIGQSIEVYGLPSGGYDTGYVYTWNNGLSSQERHTVMPATTTLYQVILNDNCTVIPDTATFTVNVRDPLALTVRADTFICQGESVILYVSATGGDPNQYTYSWDQGLGVQKDPLVSPTVNTNYFVTLADNCTTLSDTGSVYIELPVPLALTLSNDTLICRNEPVIMQADGTGGLPAHYEFDWGTLGTGGSKQVNPLVTTTYPVVFRDNCANPVTDSIRVEVQVPLIPGFVSDPEWACMPNEVDFSDTTFNSAGCWFLWEYGDGVSDTGVDLNAVTHSFPAVGTYPVRLILRSPLGCLDTSYFLDFVVYPDPVASFSYDYEENSPTDMTILFTNTTRGGQDYYWDYGDLATDELVENPSHAYAEPGIYPVVMTAVNEWGCMDSVWDTLDVKDVFRVFLPNAFTPGESDTLNSSFGPVGTGIATFKLRVYNRWGELVYETDEGKFWEGQNERSGNPAPQGVYTYVMQVYSTRGVRKTHTGVIHLLK